MDIRDTRDLLVNNLRNPTPTELEEIASGNWITAWKAVADYGDGFESLFSRAVFLTGSERRDSFRYELGKVTDVWGKGSQILGNFVTSEDLCNRYRVVDLLEGTDVSLLRCAVFTGFCEGNFCQKVLPLAVEWTFIPGEEEEVDITDSILADAEGSGDGGFVITLYDEEVGENVAEIRMDVDNIPFIEYLNDSYMVDRSGWAGGFRVIRKNSGEW